MCYYMHVIKFKNKNSCFDNDNIYWEVIMYTWGSIGDQLSGTENWLPALLDAVEWILWIALILVGACGAIYAIYVGVKMARADSSDQREEAKKRLINIIVSIVVTIVLILFFNLVLPTILWNLNVFNSYQGSDDTTQGGGGSSLNAIINTARVLIGR